MKNDKTIKRPIEAVHYGTYLQLDKILNAQETVSSRYGESAHDETLFIITHQTYELWFKQILHDLDWVLNIMKEKTLPDRQVFQIVAKLERMRLIFELLFGQLEILETMTPLDFLDFRNYLAPASGFQSIQFRLVEAKLGLKRENRLFPGEGQGLRLTSEEEKHLRQVELDAGLFKLVEDWLERMPFLKRGHFDFWQQYKNAVDKMLTTDQEQIQNHPQLTEKEKKRELESLELSRKSFASLLEKKDGPMIDEKRKHLSPTASLAALFIQLYRDEPILNGPFRLITALINLDEGLTSWRARHAMMAHRMLGIKIGTGGSSGHQYLKATVEKNRIFEDFFNLSTFLIPRRDLPELPADLRRELGLHFHE